MIQRDIVSKSLKQLKLKVKLVLNPVLTLLLISFFTGFSYSAGNKFYCKSEQVSKCCDVSSCSTANQILPCKFQHDNIPTSIEVADSEEECADEDTNDDYSLKMTHQIREAFPFVEVDKKISNKRAALTFHSSIPLFILYHSWKDDLS